MAERKKIKEQKRIIPLHFQTFGDMMMNMLTLFILLCSFATARKAKFFDAGKSFRAAGVFIWTSRHSSCGHQCF